MPRIRPVIASTVAGILAAFLVVGVPLLAQDRPPATGDEAAIREVVRKYVEAREARDPRAIGALFTADADQLVSDGQWRRGRDELVRGMLESSRKNAARRSIRLESIRFLAPGVALADGRYTQAGAADGKDRELWTTLLLTRDAKVWRIAAIRNMLPAAPAPATGR
jgi:uncharacterized protein (TIGR02246 family)